MVARFRLLAALVLTLTMLLPVFTPVASAATFTLSGRVTDGSGTAISDALMEVFFAGTSNLAGNDTTNSTGNYSVSLASGTYDIRVTPPEGTTFQVTTVFGRSITADTTLDFALVSAGAVTLSGRVLDGEGNGIGSQTVSLHQSGAPSISTQTDASGNYALQAAPGDYRLSVSWCCHIPGSAAIPERYNLITLSTSLVTLSENTTLDVPLPVKRVDVRVQDPAGNPVANVQVRTNQPTNNSMAVGSLTFDGNSLSQGTSDASGNLTLWLFPTSGSNTFTFTARPPSGTPFATFSISNVTFTSDTSLIIALQFVHAPPITTANFDPSAVGGVHPDDVTVTLSATAASGFTVVETTYSVDGGPTQVYSGPFTISGDGSHTLTVQSTDDAGVFESPKTLSVVIDSLKITTSTQLPSGREGFEYGTTLAATGGAPPYSWTIAAGSTLPDGLELDAVNGTISGTPEVSGEFSFDVDVTDSRGTIVSRTFNLELATGNRPPVPNAGGPYGVVIGEAVTLSASASDEDNDPLTYEWDFDGDGVADASGQSVTFDSAGYTAETQQTVTLKVCDPYICVQTTAIVNLISPITITTESPLPNGIVGEAYAVTLEATGGAEPYTWEIVSGDLPPGLSLDSSSGEISGTPTAAGTFGFTVQVTDSSQVTATKRFTLEPPPTGGEAGTEYPDTPIIIDPPDDTDGGPAPVCSNYVLAPGSDPLPPGMTLDAATGILSGTPENGGSYQIVIQCTYNTNQTAAKDFTITILNPAPTLTSLDPVQAVEGDPDLTMTLGGTNFVHDSVVRWNGSDHATTFVSATTLTVVIPAADISVPGTADVTVFSPGPGGGLSSALVFTIVPANLAPDADGGGPYTVDEGGSVTLNGSGIDPDGDDLAYAWDLDGDGEFETAGEDPSFTAEALDGPSSVPVNLKVCDVHDACDTASAIVNVLNVAPALGAINAPVDPVQAGQTISASVSFTDPGILDTHSAVWDWGDGTTCNTSGDTSCTVSGTDGSGTVTGDHTYVAPGVYTVSVSLTDDDGDSNSTAFQYVVVYDPDGGFVTGGGWIDSPAGACQLDSVCQGASGKANFGFVSKYKKGANVPTGNTQFHFRAGDLKFESTSYEWLVIAGAQAKFKGTGTINGEGNYGFMLTAVDGEVNGGGGTDKFRIKIWDIDDNDRVVYDNQVSGDTSDTADPSTVIGGGSIVIHK